MAAGAAAAMAAANAARIDAEEDEKRRKSHMGYDQILIKTRAGFERIGPAIAELFKDKYYYDAEDETIYQRNKNKFGIGRAALTFTCLFIGMILVDALLFHNATYENIMPLIYYGIVSLVTGFCVGLTARFDRDTEWDIVEFRKSRKGANLILIRRYDGDGCRNLNEAVIHDIIEIVTENDKEASITGL